MASKNYYWNGQLVTAEEYALLEKQQIANDAAADAVIKKNSDEFDAVTKTGTAQKTISSTTENAQSPPTATVPATTPESQKTVTTETINGVTNTVTTTPPTSDQPSNQQVANVSVDPSNPVAPGAFDTQGFENPTNTFPEVTVTATRPKTSVGQDWRVRLSLASEADYLYKDKSIAYDDILFPLVSTDGVIFPYLPAISVAYKANYSGIDITHTNYKNHFYVNSSVDDVNITADFTAQDNVEARYMLAVIHFFKSVTKMFYGQDVNPRGGTPPPLCYLTGLGAYQFNNHPLLITSFSYNLPNDVDYIRTETLDAFSAGSMETMMKKGKPKGNVFSNFLSKHRLGGANLNKGAEPAKPNFTSITTPGSKVSYVPTKLQIQINALPVVSRKDVSENFKLAGKGGYGTGTLTKGGFW